MNKVSFLHNGGFPALLDDLDFSQEATREAFYGFMSAFGVTEPLSFVISGCNLSGGSWLPGYICLAGEILRFDGQALSLPGFGNENVWDVLETNDPIGEKVFENGAIVQTFKVRKARIIAVTSAVAVNKFKVANNKTLATKLVEIVSADNPALDLTNKILNAVGASGLWALKAIEPWRVVGAVGQPAFQNGWANNFSAPARQAGFRKDNLGMVHLRGVITGNNGATIFQLPSGYRPTSNNDVCFSVPAGNGTNANYVLFVDSSGNITMGGSPGTTVNFFLNPVKFHVD